MSLFMTLPVGLNPTLLEIMDTNDAVNYYTDLELAAAIGKNLLGRNKELDLLLRSTQEYVEEQVRKSEYLSHQLDDARQMNESRAELMEQIESNSVELSRSHTQLKMETRSIWEHNQSLTESVETLAEKCNHYKTEMEDLRMANARLQRHLSTQNSVKPKAPEECQSRDYEKELVEKEVLKLSVAIQELKTEQNQEKSAREELENELSQLIIQNQDLEQKLQLFAKGSSSRNSFVKENERDSIKRDIQVEEEIDDDDESYSDDSFVLVESQDIEELVCDLSQEQCDISFLDELDQQYRELVTKYNSLLEKCKNEGIPYESHEICMVQRGVQTSEAVREADDGNGVEEGMPEYKKMFAIIYEKLREGRDDCEERV